MTEKQLRQSVVTIMKGWVGRKEADGSHKHIIDIYNAHKPLARGYKVKYTDEWCATTVSAAFIKAGLTDIGFTECSCGKMIELYKAKGRWVEDDAYVPQIGDIVMYYWKDDGAGDCTEWPNHVGIVTAVNGSTLTITEGNKGEAVANRTLKVNAKYIRGYCIPNYASKVTATSVATVSISLQALRKGSKGATVASLQQLLTAKGYDPDGVDSSFGPATEAAVKRFQKAKGLAQTGVCDKATWTALLTK